MEKRLLIVCFMLMIGVLMGCSLKDVSPEEMPPSDPSEPVTDSVNSEIGYETLTFEAEDGLQITADYYKNPNADKLLILFHQAGWSRGEYRETAPSFVEMGFQVLAVDLRSGGEVKGVNNETAFAVKETSLKKGREGAYIDMVSALRFAKKTYSPKQTIVLGSSYSAALALILGKEHASDVDAIIAMSPGEYVKLNGKTVSENVAGLSCPVFITSGKSEYREWEGIAEAIDEKELTVFLPEVEGAHGGEALWIEIEGHDTYFSAIAMFLDKIK